MTNKVNMTKLTTEKNKIMKEIITTKIRHD